jgi:hypothetical protein
MLAVPETIPIFRKWFFSQAIGLNPARAVEHLKEHRMTAFRRPHDSLDGDSQGKKLPDGKVLVLRPLHASDQKSSEAVSARKITSLTKAFDFALKAGVKGRVVLPVTFDDATLQEYVLGENVPGRQLYMVDNSQRNIYHIEARPNA